jgi:hypothetical protein
VARRRRGNANEPKSDTDTVALYGMWPGPLGNLLGGGKAAGALLWYDASPRIKTSGPNTVCWRICFQQLAGDHCPAGRVR